MLKFLRGTIVVLLTFGLCSAAAQVSPPSRAKLVQLQAPARMLPDTGRLFLEPGISTVESNPTSVAIGDFNGDGKPDLAVANYCGDDPTCQKYPRKSTVSILLGKGDGTFQPHVDYYSGEGSQAIVVADFNGDGKLDISVVNASSVMVLLGNGNGTFQPGKSYVVNPQPQAQVVGDFNGDGKLDIATANFCGANSCTSTGTVSILLGNGDGTFQKDANYDVDYNPDAIATADVNGDGKLDLVVVNNCFRDYYYCTGTDSVITLLGRGDGTFYTKSDYNTGTSPTSVLLADFDHDGKVDMAVVNSAEGTLGVYLGAGDGTWPPPVYYPLSYGALWAVVGDFNGDGKLDVAAAGWDLVGILFGNGDGTFQPHVDYGAGYNAVFLATSDLNGDGNLDFVTPGSYLDYVTVLLNNGDGTFHTRRAYPPASPSSVITFAISGDFNGDGKTDLATGLGLQTSGVGIMLGNGDGTFQPQTITSTSYPPQALTSADFNRDGKLDLVATIYNSNSVGVLPGNGDGTFQPEVDYATAPEPYQAAVGDFNHDGKLDLAVSTDCTNVKTCGQTGAVSILLGNGDGTFRRHYDFAVGTQPLSLATADFNGDGNLDLAVANSGSNSVSIMLGEGNGNFQPAVNYATAFFPSSVTIADLDGDGRPDIVTGNSFGASMSVLINNGDGTFAPHVDYTTLGGTVVAGDFNHDGHLDLATTSLVGVAIFLGNGDGTFQPPLYYLGRGSVYVAADFDGDGKLDLVLSGADLEILLNTQN